MKRTWLLILPLLLALPAAAANCWTNGTTIGAGQVLANVGSAADCPRATAAADRQGTFANRPASPTTGQKYFATDLGSGLLLIYDGAKWKPSGGSAILYQAYPNATITGDTSEHDLVDLTMPAGLLSANGRIQITMYWGANSTANGKTTRVRYGTTATGTSNTQIFFNGYTTNSTQAVLQSFTQGANSTSSQISIGNNNNGFTNSGGSYVTTSVTTASTASYFNLTAQLATGTDSQTLYAYTVQWQEP